MTWMRRNVQRAACRSARPGGRTRRPRSGRRGVLEQAELGDAPSRAAARAAGRPGRAARARGSSPPGACASCSWSSACASPARSPKRRKSVPLPTPAAAAIGSIDTVSTPCSAKSRAAAHEHLLAVALRRRRARAARRRGPAAPSGCGSWSASSTQRSVWQRVGHEPWGQRPVAPAAAARPDASATSSGAPTSWPPAQPRAAVGRRGLRRKTPPSRPAATSIPAPSSRREVERRHARVLDRARDRRAVRRRQRRGLDGAERAVARGVDLGLRRGAPAAGPASRVVEVVGVRGREHRADRRGREQPGRARDRVVDRRGDARRRARRRRRARSR